MRAQIGYVLDVEDAADAQALTAAIEELFADGGITVVASHSAIDEHPYTVVGLVRGKPDQRWKEHVSAADAKEAERKAMAMGPKNEQRAVADVFEGYR